MDPALAAAAFEAAKHEAYEKELEQRNMKVDEPIPFVNQARTRVMEGTMPTNDKGAAQVQQQHQEAAPAHELQQHEAHQHTEAAIDNKLDKEHKDPAAAIENKRDKDHQDPAAALENKRDKDHKDPAAAHNIHPGHEDAAPVLEAHPYTDRVPATAPGKDHEALLSKPPEAKAMKPDTDQQQQMPQKHEQETHQEVNNMEEPACKRRVRSKQQDIVGLDVLPKPACMEGLPVLSPAEQADLCRSNLKDEDQEPEPKTKRKPRGKAKAKAKGRPRAKAKAAKAKAAPKTKGKPKAAAKPKAKASGKAKAKARSKKQVATDEAGTGDDVEMTGSNAGKARLLLLETDLPDEEMEQEGDASNTPPAATGKRNSSGPKQAEKDAPVPPCKRPRSSTSKQKAKAAEAKKKEAKAKNARKSKAYQRAKKAALDAGLTVEEAKAKGQQASRHLYSFIFWVALYM